MQELARDRLPRRLARGGVRRRAGMAAARARHIDASTTGSIRACRERWPESRRRRGAKGPAASAWTVAGASAVGVTGTGPITP
jgi:hypothetical protein